MASQLGDKLSFSEIKDFIHTLPVSEVFSALGTSSLGLSYDEANKRRIVFGLNTIQKIKVKPLYLRLLAQFTHLMAILLWVCGAMALVANMPQLAIAIWMVNIINGVFSSWQEYRAHKVIESLRRMIPMHAIVLRDGKTQQILAEDLVPGDIVLLKEGDQISADARLVEDVELKVDQSTFTGESRPVHKLSSSVTQTGLTSAELPNLVYTGTTVVSGTGKAVVFATGMKSEFGHVAHLTQTVKEPPSPLQKEMVWVTRVITMIAVSVGILFFVLAASLTKMDLIASIIFGIGIIVALVPEGLLPTVTLALAIGTQRMARRHALIKRLSAIETLGCTTLICTDKTGTLTQNEMTVTDIWIARRRLKVTGIGYSPEGNILENGQPLPTPIIGDLRQLTVAAALCNNAHLVPPNEYSSHWTAMGDRTEAAMLTVALKCGIDLEAELNNMPRQHEIPFESRRHRMSTIHQAPTAHIAYVKGAPEEILALSNSIWLDGEKLAMDDNLRLQIKSAYDDYANNGLRVLAVALHFLLEDLNEYVAEIVERDLTFLGLMAMIDPPRQGVVESVEKCHHAGIRIIMTTGDYGLTAENIARSIGIIRCAQPKIITGNDLNVMEDRELIEAMKGEVIFARVAPKHKLRLCGVLQKMGHVVAVTGDGVNDAPALRKADIGVAMGISGTDVAREASDIILTDDNFASIIVAIEEGRAIYANIKKFTTYIFTSNTPEAIPFVAFALSRSRIPLALNVLHILSIDLGTDIAPALALGVEAPETGMMDKAPRSLKEHIITPVLLIRAYIWLGLLQSAAAMAAFYFQYWTNGYWGQWLDLPTTGTMYRSATAMALAAVVTTQIGNVFTQRTETTSIFRINPFKNKLIWLGITVELAFIVSITYVPLLQDLVGTAAFPVQNWLFLFCLVPLLPLADEFRKALLRRKAKSIQPPTVRASEISRPGKA